MAFVRYRIRRTLNQLAGRRLGDDFYWADYNVRYREEIAQNERHFTQRLTSGDFAFSNGSLQATRDVRPLHPNFRLLYETVLQLKPESVLELGCGGGDHLHNLHVLAPEIALYGVDRDAKQLAYLRERHPGLSADVRMADATLPLPSDLPDVDLAYTQAVIMHLQEGNSHLVALANLFRVARRHVVLMEHWRRHEYADDLQSLREQRVIDWPEIHLHYRDSPELGRPHLLIASREPLDFPVLEDFATLRDAVA